MKRQTGSSHYGSLTHKERTIVEFYERSNSPRTTGTDTSSSPGGSRRFSLPQIQKPPDFKPRPKRNFGEVSTNDSDEESEGEGEEEEEEERNESKNGTLDDRDDVYSGFSTFSFGRPSSPLPEMQEDSANSMFSGFKFGSSSPTPKKLDPDCEPEDSSNISPRGPKRDKFTGGSSSTTGNSEHEKEEPMDMFAGFSFGKQSSSPSVKKVVLEIPSVSKSPWVETYGTNHFTNYEDLKKCATFKEFFAGLCERRNSYANWNVNELEGLFNLVISFSKKNLPDESVVHINKRKQRKGSEHLLLAEMGEAQASLVSLKKEGQTKQKEREINEQVIQTLTYQTKRKYMKLGELKEDLQEETKIVVELEDLLADEKRKTDDEKVRNTHVEEKEELERRLKSMKTCREAAEDFEDIDSLFRQKEMWGDERVASMTVHLEALQIQVQKQRELIYHLRESLESQNTECCGQ